MIPGTRQCASRCLNPRPSTPLTLLAADVDAMSGFEGANDCCRLEAAGRIWRMNVGGCQDRSVGVSRRGGPLHFELDVRHLLCNMQATPCSTGRQWLLSEEASWCCRPKAVICGSDLAAEKKSPNDCTRRRPSVAAVRRRTDTASCSACLTMGRPAQVDGRSLVRAGLYSALRPVGKRHRRMHREVRAPEIDVVWKYVTGWMLNLSFWR